MRELTCRDARLWLQAPRDLTGVEKDWLHAHLDGCGACEMLRLDWEAMDEHIRAAFASLPAGRSVRSAVHARIRDMQQPRRRRIRLSPRTFLPALIAAPLALLVVAAALVVPRLLPSGRSSVPSGAVAAFRLVRIHIGYPFALDPTRPNHLLAATPGRVYESWNAGAFWHPLAPLPGGVIRAMAIDGRNPRHYLVAVKHSIYLSTDAGRHWRVTATGELGAMNMLLIQDPRSPNVFYAGPSTVLKSTDGGRTWQQAGLGRVFAPYGIQALSAGPNGTLLTGIWGGGVAVSRDGGVTWERRAHGLAPNVMDVTGSSGNGLYAATDRGLYVSADGGSSWKQVDIPGRLFATSVAVQGSTVLTGGRNGLYRSGDAGRHWDLSMRGLPLAPYINSMVADPHVPGRFYASLDGDGLFRSDDGGRHWKGLGNGIPLAGSDGGGRAVLFLRAGVLWNTDTSGSDPGNLTVESDVRLASLAPDGAAAAYSAGTENGWVVRVLAIGGSSARTLIEGSGTLPHALLWSPDSSRLAIVNTSGVTVTNLAHRLVTWPLSAGERVLGWAPGGQGVLLWEESTGAIVLRGWMGRPLVTERLRMPAPPVMAPGGRRFAALQSGRLLISALSGPAVQRSVSARCTNLHWSDDGALLLVRCGSSVQIRSSVGRLLVQTRLRGHVSFAPGAHSSLFVYRRRGLWSWTPGRGLRPIVPDAEPVAP